MEGYRTDERKEYGVPPTLTQSWQLKLSTRKPPGSKYENGDENQPVRRYGKTQRKTWAEIGLPVFKTLGDQQQTHPFQ
jgi:hypothetical protein